MTREELRLPFSCKRGYTSVDNLKIPNFEISQVALDDKGCIIQSAESFAAWIGESNENLLSRNFHELITSIDPSWSLVIDQNFHLNSFEKFLPISSTEGESF